uniref:PPM-type phosphatase domain-containing protein n=1 Tax=Caenorhabditis tropicalis TaxID=1561998 RepID=A0A1I7U737_9PELO
MMVSHADLPIASSTEQKTRGHLESESFAPELRQKAATITSLSIFGTPSDQECQPIPVVPRSSSSDELRVWRVTSAGLVEVDAKTMGAFLDKPKTDKTNVHGEGNGIRYGMSSMQGWRICMEDSHIAEAIMSQSSPYKDWSFFAVFDGHAGHHIANRASSQLLEHLISSEEFLEMTKALEENNGVLTDSTLKLLESGIKKGFLSFDEISKASNEISKSGCTAVCAIVTPTHIIIGNLGDSRAVVAGKNDIFGTEDHKPYLEKERKRIEDAGGSVMIQRINGSLAVSRAFGDYEYKDDPRLPADQQLVSPEPDVYIRPRNIENDEFMVVACDGIYDVMTNEELAEFVRDRLVVHPDLREVCDDVLDECLVKGSRDNMTMVVVCFPAAPAVNVHRKEAEEAWVNRVKTVINQFLDEAVAAENFKKEEDMVSLKSIMDKVTANGLLPTNLRVPAHTVTTLAQKILAQREIKHV